MHGKAAVILCEKLRIDPTGLNPSSATPGGSAFTLTANGTNFVTGSMVRWNGANRTTTYVSGTQLTAQITKADIAAVSKSSVDVLNPDGCASNKLSFLVGAPKTVYLPLVLNSYPPIPTVPVLNAIANADGNGNYTVSWNAGHQGHQLSPARGRQRWLYESGERATPGPARHGTPPGKAVGTYYYRVQAVNAWGPSGWSKRGLGGSAATGIGNHTWFLAAS